MPSIIVKGAKTHNLKDINLSIPLGQTTVVTGVSGSGKSSLVFDTLYAESYRRYLDSLSSYARQYLKALPKPAVQLIQNLPPSIAIKQNIGQASNRSTVGTLSEISDYLQLLFSNHSDCFCPRCNRPVYSSSPKEVVAKIEEKFAADSTVFVLASLKHLYSQSKGNIKDFLIEQGFLRVLNEEQNIERLEDVTEKLSNKMLIIDRIRGIRANKQRLIQAIELGYKIGNGRIKIQSKNNNIQEYFASQLICFNCNLKICNPSPELFSFNHPLGACKSCQGYGKEREIDWSKVFPKSEGSIKQKSIEPLNFGTHGDYYKTLEKKALERGLDPEKLFSYYSAADWAWLKDGQGVDFTAMRGYFQWLDSKKYKLHYRVHAAKFMTYRTCKTCNGKRLKEDARAFRALNKNFSDLHDLSIDSLDLWIADLVQRKEVSHEKSDQEILELRQRTRYLVDVGLGYLQLNRSISSLSGGEMQRIRLARSLGSVLTNTLFCLDEPTSGLHAYDSSKLFNILKKVQHQGNTLVIVEHDRDLLQSADYVIEIGPNAGAKGGEVTYAGKPLANKQHIHSMFKFKQDILKSHRISFSGINCHNLKDLSFELPLNASTVICGVSGSGKSSLIEYVLWPLLDNIVNKKSKIGGGDIFLGGPIKELSEYQSVEFMNQKNLARSSRSNLATYLGVYDGIRKIFSEQPEARKHNLKPGAFSFNVAGGRCETCKGLGYVNEDLSFLGDVDVQCPVCRGRRFIEKVLGVKFRKKSITEILNLTVVEAIEFFYDQKKVVQALQVLDEVGLGYLSLGQSTSTLSGGEAHRLKISDVLQEKNANQNKKIFIIDEPTVGLSDLDVRNLQNQFDSLVSYGHTLIIVEHHLGVIRSADYLIELGPGAGSDGGQLVFQGKPCELKQSENSKTKQYIFC